MPKITIIMPALNVALYLRECMDSVLGQTLQDLQILFVDAGSTDGTIEIVEEYVSRDDRIKLIRSDKKSYGYQLNLGIEQARGEYVGVVETDDVVRKDMFETLYRKAAETDADYVKASAEVFVDASDGMRVSRQVSLVFDDEQMFDAVICPKEIPELFVRDVYLWTGIYKNDFIKTIRLNESRGAAFQDSGFMFQAYSRAERAVYLTTPFYYYRQDNKNASSYDERGFSYFVGEYDYIRGFMSDLSEGWMVAYYKRMLDHCRRRFNVMAVSGHFWEEAFPSMSEMQERLQNATDEGILSDLVLDADRWKDLELFLESPVAIYEACRGYYGEKEKELAQLTEWMGEREAVVFGTTELGKFVHALIESRYPSKIVAYCDNKEEIQGTSVQGKAVLSPEEAARQYPEAVYILTSVRGENDMKKQMQRYGISVERMRLSVFWFDLLFFQLRF